MRKKFNPYLSNLLFIIGANIYIHLNEYIFLTYLNDESCLNNFSLLYYYLCLILNLYIAFVIILNVGYALTNCSCQFKEKNNKSYLILLWLSFACLLLLVLLLFYFSDKFIKVLLDILCKKLGDSVIRMMGRRSRNNLFGVDGQPKGQGGEPPVNPDPGGSVYYGHRPNQDDNNTNSKNQNNDNLQEDSLFYSEEPSDTEQQNNSNELEENSGGDGSSNVNSSENQSLLDIEARLASNTWVKSHKKIFSQADRESYNEYSKLRKRISRAVRSEDNKARTLNKEAEARRLKREQENAEEKNVRLNKRKETEFMGNINKILSKTTDAWIQAEADRKEKARAVQTRFRANLTEEQKEAMRAKARDKAHEKMRNETPEERRVRLEKRRQYRQKKSSNTSTKK